MCNGLLTTRGRTLRSLRLRAAALAALLLCTSGAMPAVRAAQPAAPFFFIQLSDPQFGMFSEDRDFAQETINFEFAIATVNRLRPAFLVITGDLVNKTGDAAQIAEYHRIVGKLDPSIPLHHMPGNHDLGNVPTPASVAAYVKAFGPDRYTFRHGDVLGIVLDSTLIHSPQDDPADAAAQEQWLRTELTNARSSGARHIVVFQHHPWFLESPSEPDQYFNIPLVRRTPYLALFRAAGVKYLVSGHYHRNAIGRDGTIEMITTGPIGKPLEGAQSGMRIFTVTDGGLSHAYYELGEIPDRIAGSAKP
jgi:UDP-2,3-diacylglucosamine pyrophosphatase LpxH